MRNYNLLSIKCQYILVSNNVDGLKKCLYSIFSNLYFSILNKVIAAVQKQHPLRSIFVFILYWFIFVNYIELDFCTGEGGQAYTLASTPNLTPMLTRFYNANTGEYKWGQMSGPAPMLTVSMGDNMQNEWKQPFLALALASAPKCSHMLALFI